MPARKRGLLSGAVSLSVLPVEDAHDQIAVPLTIDEHRLALPAFYAETDFLVAADCTVVVFDNPKVDSAELKVIEGIPENQNRRLGARAYAYELCAVHTNGKARTPVIVGDIKVRRSDEPVPILDRPSAGVLPLLFVPGSGNFGAGESGISCGRPSPSELLIPMFKITTVPTSTLTHTYV